MTLPLPFRPQAVVFDLDGLLVDSEPLWAAAEAEVVRSFGHAWRPEMQQALLGKGPDEAAAALADLLGGLDAAMVKRRMMDASERHFRRGVALQPGAARLVAGLVGHVPLGVATNSRRVLADLVLASAGLAGHIDAVVTADDVARPKPDPEPYTRACRLLGADATRCVAFEDSPTGVASAAAAGLWVVGCPSFASTRLDGADAVVASLSAVEPDALLAAA